MLSLEGLSGKEKMPKLKIKVVEAYNLEVVEKEIDGYRTVQLPTSIRKYFDQGYDAVRIRSTNTAKQFPDYGGGTTPGSSLLPHQDHTPSDPRRFLALSKEEDSKRGAGTYIARPEAVANALPQIIAYFNENREAIKKSYEHIGTFKLSKKEIKNCFEEGGLDDFVTKILGSNPTEEEKLFVYCGILSYLIQGKHADRVVEKFLNDNKNSVEVENWEEGGVFIIDNSKVFHGRIGDNENALKRNWCI